MATASHAEREVLRLLEPKQLVGKEGTEMCSAFRLHTASSNVLDGLRWRTASSGRFASEEECDNIFQSIHRNTLWPGLPCPSPSIYRRNENETRASKRVHCDGVER